MIERLTGNAVAGCGAHFFVGVLLFLSCNALSQQATRWVAVLGLVAGLIIVCAMLTLPVGGRQNMILTYGVTPCIVIAVAAFDRTGARLPFGLHWIGESTYAIYLIHMPMIIAAKTFMPQWFSDPSFLVQPIALACYVGSVLLAAYPIYRTIELPLQRYIRRQLT